MEGRLHILRGSFNLRTEFKNTFVHEYRANFIIANELLADRTMGTLNHHYPGGSSSDPEMIFSDCFEKLCARSTTQERHGTFFSVVHRKIGDLDIIMAGEVDCSSSMDLR